MATESREAMDEVSERILDAASNCIRTIGLDQATVQDIVDAAGVSRSTYYRRFRSFDELLVELAIRRWVRRLPAVMTALSVPDTSAAVRWRDFIANIVLQASDNSADALFDNTPSLWVTRLFYGANGDRRERVIATISPLVRQAQMAGEMRGDLAAERIAEWILRQSWSLHSLPMGVTWKRQELDDYITTFILPGILVRPTDQQTCHLLDYVGTELEKLAATVRTQHQSRAGNESHTESGVVNFLAR